MPEDIQVEYQNRIYNLRSMGAELEDGTSNGCFYLCLRRIIAEHLKQDVEAVTLKKKILQYMGLQGRYVNRMAESEDVRAAAELFGLRLEVHTIYCICYNKIPHYFTSVNNVCTFGKGSKTIRLAVLSEHYYVMF